MRERERARGNHEPELPLIYHHENEGRVTGPVTTFQIFHGQDYAETELGLLSEGESSLQWDTAHKAPGPLKIVLM